ncbi:MAG: restriction endonuclease subunit S, partial [Nitrospira sp.]|nr:restriction endonuclease subunit S [Nitrospira sp.]
MAKVESIPLAEVVEFERGVVAPSNIGTDTLCLSLEDLNSLDGTVDPNGMREAPKSTKFRFSSDHVLYGKLRPYLRKVARPTTSGVCSTDILPIHPSKRLDRDYLFHFLRSSEFTLSATRAAVGMNLPRISPNVLSTFAIPLPPLSEQRRIAEILDKADALRAKRRAALAQLDTLTQSIFLDMFGDPATNPKGWPRITLKQALTIPLRNGLSPSKAGKVSAQVLTLSAITGSAFDDAARKVSTFLSSPPADQSVASKDFLICRGNGNIQLIGRGKFPTCSMPEVTFPDTMIAARVSDQLIEPAFLQDVWNSIAVRQQIES